MHNPRGSGSSSLHTPYSAPSAFNNSNPSSTKPSSYSSSSSSFSSSGPSSSTHSRISAGQTDSPPLAPSPGAHPFGPSSHAVGSSDIHDGGGSPLSPSLSDGKPSSLVFLLQTLEGLESAVAQQIRNFADGKPTTTDPTSRLSPSSSTLSPSSLDGLSSFAAAARATARPGAQPSTSSSSSSSSFLSPSSYSSTYGSSTTSHLSPLPPTPSTTAPSSASTSFFSSSASGDRGGSSSGGSSTTRPSASTGGARSWAPPSSSTTSATSPSSYESRAPATGAHSSSAAGHHPLDSHRNPQHAHASSSRTPHAGAASASYAPPLVTSILSTPFTTSPSSSSYYSSSSPSSSAVSPSQQPTQPAQPPTGHRRADDAHHAHAATPSPPVSVSASGVPSAVSPLSSSSTGPPAGPASAFSAAILLHHELKEVEKKIEHEYVKVEQQKQALAQREGPSPASLAAPQDPSHTCAMCATCVCGGGHRGGQYREAEAVDADSGVPEEGGTARNPRAAPSEQGNRSRH